MVGVFGRLPPVPAHKSRSGALHVFDRMNGTIGPDGSVPTFIVSGSLSRFPSIVTDLHPEQERLYVLCTDLEETETIVSAQHISRALTTRFPTSTRQAVVTSDYMRVYMERRTS